MEFPGLLKKEQVDFLGTIKTNEEFPGLIMKKSCGIPRVLDFSLTISVWCNTILWGF